MSATEKYFCYLKDKAGNRYAVKDATARKAIEDITPVINEHSERIEAIEDLPGVDDLLQYREDITGVLNEMSNVKSDMENMDADIKALKAAGVKLYQHNYYITGSSKMEINSSLISFTYHIYGMFVDSNNTTPTGTLKKFVENTWRNGYITSAGSWNFETQEFYDDNVKGYINKIKASVASSDSIDIRFFMGNEEFELSASSSNWTLTDTRTEVL